MGEEVTFINKLLKNRFIYLGITTLLVFGSISLFLLLFPDSYRPSVTTLHYLYSALLQGFAALSALLLTILGFIYARIQVARDVHMTGTVNAANQLLGRQPAGYEDYVNSAKRWLETECRELTADLTLQFQAAEAKYKPLSDPAYRSKPQVVKMEERFQELRNKRYWLGEYVSNLARFMKSDREFQDRIPADIICAVGPAFLVILLSMLFLAGSDDWFGSEPLAAIVVMYFSTVSIVFAGVFFRSMLRVVFGTERPEGFEETGIPKPEDADAILDKIRKTMWPPS